MHNLTCSILALALGVMVIGAGAVVAKPVKVSDARYADLAKVFDRMRSGDHVTIAYLGGSITWGSNASDPMKTSYRALVTKYLTETYSQAHITAVDAAIGGTGSLLGVFRMDRDVLPYKPDLTFVEFAVNDNDWKDTQETMEGIVRKLKASNPHMAVVILTIGAGYKYSASQASAPQQELASYYGLPMVDIAGTVIAKGIDGHDILNDGCHPNDAGYQLYTSIITENLNRFISEKGKAMTTLPKPLTQNRYETAHMIELAKLSNLGDWKPAKPSVVGTWFDHQPSRWQSSAIAPSKDGASLQFELECRGVGLYYETVQGGSPLHLKADGLATQDMTTDMSLQYARVGYKFVVGDALQKRMITLTADKADKKDITKAAYIFYTK